MNGRLASGRLHIHLPALVSLLTTAIVGGWSSPCLADGPEISGDLTLSFTRILDNQGNLTGYQYNGAAGSVAINHNFPIVVPIAFAELGTPGLSWAEDAHWNNSVLNFTNNVIVARAVIGAGTGEISIRDGADAVDVLQHQGPTERSLEVSPFKVFSLDTVIGYPLGFEVRFGGGITLQFDVTLPTGADVLMDQEAKLERLTVQTGAKLIGDPRMVIRTDLRNSGFIGNLSGLIQGNFYNDGNPVNGERAFVDGNLNLQGQLYNIGEIRIHSGTMYLHAASTLNNGTIVLEGGSLQTGPELHNYGTVDLRTRGNAITVGRLQRFTNSGSVLQREMSALMMESDAITTNLAGAVYDLQQDADILSVDTSQNLFDQPVFVNAGTLRKSSGDGESIIGSPDYGMRLRNTGTIEVLGGTLKVQGGDFRAPSELHSGRHVFSDGARLQFGGYYDLRGINTIAGNGAIELLPGQVTLAADQTAALIGAEATIELNGGHIWRERGSTLTINVKRLRLNNGSIAGVGGTTDTDAVFEWTGGLFGYGGRFTTNNQAIITGRAEKWIYNDTAFHNAGTLAHHANATVTMGSRTHLQNEAGAIYDLQGDADIVSEHTSQNIFDNPVFVNAGTLRKSSGDGESIVGSQDYGIRFRNTGTIEVNSGTLKLQSGSDRRAPSELHNGRFVVSDSARLQLRGVYDLRGNNTIVGNGTIELLPGEIMLAADQIATLTGTEATIEINGGSIWRERGSTLTINVERLRLKDGSIAGFGGVTNTNAIFEWTGGLFGYGGRFTTTNRTIIAGTAEKWISEATAFHNSGLVTHQADAVVKMGTSTHLENEAGAIYDLQGDADILSERIGGYSDNPVFVNAGTLRKSSGDGESVIGSTDFGIRFQNRGTVDVRSGTLKFQTGGGHVHPRAEISDGGRYVFANGARLQLVGSYDLKGNQTLAGDGTLEILQGEVSIAADQTATFTGTGASIDLNGGSFWLPGGKMNIDLSDAGRFHFKSGVVGGHGSITNNSIFEWSGGSLGVGTFTTTKQTMIAGPADKWIMSSFHNSGSLAHQAHAALKMGSNSQFTNAVGGIYDLQGDADILSERIGNFSSNPVFVNAGTLRKSSGDGESVIGTATFGIQLRNSGTIEVDRGTLTINSLASLNGTTLIEGVYDLNAMLRLPGADIRRNEADIVLDGPSGAIVDQSGADALRNLHTNSATGLIDVRNGKVFSVSSLENAGTISIGASSTLIVPTNLTNTGMLSVSGIANIGELLGTGDTIIGPNATLSVGGLEQDSLRIGRGGRVTLLPGSGTAFLNGLFLADDEQPLGIPQAVPEPSAWLLAVVSLLVLAGLSCRVKGRRFHPNQTR